MPSRHPWSSGIISRGLLGLELSLEHFLQETEFPARLVGGLHQCLVGTQDELRAGLEGVRRCLLHAVRQRRRGILNEKKIHQPDLAQQVQAFCAGAKNVKPPGRSFLQALVHCDQEADKGRVHVGALREIDEYRRDARRFLQAREKGLPQRIAQSGPDAAYGLQEISTLVLSHKERVMRVAHRHIAIL